MGLPDSKPGAAAKVPEAVLAHPRL